MATQNLVSASISKEVQDSVTALLDKIKSDLSNIFVSLLPEEKNEYQRVGNQKLPLLDKAHSVVELHPEIMSGVFDKVEYESDYQLAKALIPIAAKIAELDSAVQMALYAVQSDLMVSSLDIYSTAQTNAGKIPGMDVILAEMKEFFKKTKRNKETPKT